MRGSLVRQLLTRLLVISSLALLATGVLLWWQFDHASSLILDRGLGDKMQVIIDSLAVDENDKVVAHLPNGFEAQFKDDLFFTVTDAHGLVFLSIPAGRERSYHPFEPKFGDKPQFFEHNYLHSGENYLGVTARAVVGKREVWIQLVEELPHWQNFLHYSLQIYLSGVGGIIILHFFGSSLLAHRTLRTSFAPVETAARQARRIVPGKRDIRIDATDLPAEVVPFAEAVNSALARLEKALAAQKRFTADAAHELLTPLAIVRADIDNIADRETAETVSGDIEEMVGIVTQLLELSEIESVEQMPDEVFDLREVARDVLMRLAPLAIQRGIEPEITGAEEPVFVRGSTKAISTAIGNLVKNAVIHGSGATRLAISVDHGGVLSVSDDGPGVPQALHDRIFERFQRAPGAWGGGKGLGLAIVDRIVAAHGGTVSAEDGPGGKGARFVIQLPR